MSRVSDPLQMQGRSTSIPVHDAGAPAHEHALQLKQVKDYKSSGFRMSSSLSRLGAAAKNIIHPPVYQRNGQTKTRVDWGKLVGRSHNDKLAKDWREPLMRTEPDGEVRMNNTTTGHALAERLNQESAYCDIAIHTDFEAPDAGAPAHMSYTMKDKDDNYRQVMQTPAVVCVLKSSLPQGQGGDVTTPERRAGPSTLGETTGVFTDCHGGQFRVREKKMYRFDAQSNRWRPHQAEVGDVKRIMLDHRGEIVALRGSSANTDKFYTPRHSVALSKRGSEVTLNDVASGSLQALKLQNEDGTPFNARQIGLLEDGPDAPPRLMAIDKDGKLFKSPRLSASGGGVQALTLVAQTDDHRHALGESATGSRLHGFYHEGGLKAIVEDRHGRYHALPVGSQRLEPGWLMSGQWEAGNRTGLPSAVGVGDPKVTLHGGASLALNKESKELFGWQEMFQDWRPMKSAPIDQLSHGLDNKAYVLQKGQLKPL